MDAGISTHVHTESVCVRVRVWCTVCLLTAANAQWTEDDLLIGDSMEHIEEETCSAGLSLSLLQKVLDLFHLPSRPQLALCAVGGKPHTHTASKPGCSASSPASLPHEWLPYCNIVYGYCWQVTQSHWLKHGELTIASGGGIPAGGLSLKRNSSLT